MDDKIKMELVRTGVPAVVVPGLRAILDHKMSMRQMEKRKEMEIEMAERKQQGVKQLARMRGSRADAGPASAAGTQPATSPAPVDGDAGGDVYEELNALKSETDCQFCHGVADSLMDAPVSEAQRGLNELRSFVREQERIEGEDINEERAERIVSDLVDGWEVVPRHATGVS